MLHPEEEPEGSGRGAQVSETFLGFTVICFCKEPTTDPTDIFIDSVVVHTIDSVGCSFPAHSPTRITTTMY